MTSNSKPSNLPAALALSASIVVGGTPGIAAAGDAPKNDATPTPTAQTASAVVPSGAPISGLVLDVDGKTPVGGAKLSVRDASGKLVAEAVADKDGKYALAKLPAGTYVLRCGRASMRLTVQDSAAPNSLTFILPPSIALAATATQAASPVKAAENDEDIPAGAYWVAGGTIVAVGLGTGLLIDAAADSKTFERGSASPTVP